MYGEAIDASLADGSIVLLNGKLQANPKSLRQDRPELLRMGAWLGYTYLLREDRSKVIPLSTFVLPPNPFTIIRPFVIVTELVLDKDGRSIVIPGTNKLQTKHKVRWIGFRSFR